MECIHVRSIRTQGGQESELVGSAAVHSSKQKYTVEAVERSSTAMRSIKQKLDPNSICIDAMALKMFILQRVHKIMEDYTRLKRSIKNKMSESGKSVL